MNKLLMLCLGLAAIVQAGSARAREIDFLSGDKLVLTNGVSTIEGTSGGGIATWATISGREEGNGVGVTGHVTVIDLPDFGWQSHGLSIGFGNRVELSYARQNFDTRDVGAALGIGRGYMLNQDVLAAKLRLFGDLVYGEPLMPQVSIGIERKRNLDGPIAATVGADSDTGTDFTLSASKLVLAHSILLSGTVRYTEANQNGLLGFGSASGKNRSLQFEGSAAYQFSRRFIAGAEFRSKPDNLDLGENDWFDLFAAYAVNDNVTVTAAYVDLGSIATFDQQRGAFLSAQLAF